MTNGIPRVALVLAAGVCLTLGACAAQETQGANPAYAAEFEAAREAASDPRIAAMLADNDITDEEVAESLEITVQCLRDRGLEADAESDGGFRVKIDGLDSSHVNAVITECESGASALIQSLHSAIRTNPNNEDPVLLLIDCFKRAGLVDASMTKEEWRSQDHTWDPDDPQVAACLESPATAHMD